MRRAITILLLAAANLDMPRITAAEPTLDRIAFGSCLSQEKPQPIWNAVLASQPELFIFLGDNIYGDTDNIEVLKSKYSQLAAVPGYQKLLKSCPVIATWDDHDYGIDDAGGDFSGKVASQKVFLDFFEEPAESPRRRREGVYGSWVFGPEGKRVQLILLDTRYFRSPLKKNSGKAYVANTDANATILGEAQWKWLEQQLKFPAELRLIGSSIQVVAEDHPFEKWINIPHERERFFRLLRDTKANGVIILSGDRHLAELSQTDAGLGYPLYDLTASGLNMGNKRLRAPEKNSHRVATMTSGDNFGFITIDWEHKPAKISLQIRDGDGDIVIQKKLDLSDLTPAVPVASKAAAEPKSQPVTPGAVTPAEAAQKVNNSVTLEMLVKATGKARDNSRVFLNSGNFQDADNFTVVLDVRKIGEALKAAGIADPAAYYKGKTVKVKGTVSLFREKPQIVVEDLANIDVIEK